MTAFRYAGGVRSEVGCTAATPHGGSCVMTVNMILKEQLDSLFNPKAVVVIGASSVFGKWGYNLLSRVLSHSHGRQVYVVNNKEANVLGMKAYKSPVDVPGPVDFAVISVPYSDIPVAMEACVQKGVRTAVIVSGGFAETDEEGLNVERRVVEIAQRGGIRFVGPNCLGYFDTYSDFGTVPFLPPMKRGNVAVVSQSGNSGQSILDLGHQMGLGFSKFISSGNEADLRFEDFLEYLADDENTKIILGYVEGFRDGKRFLELAREISRKKPIIVLKGGRSDVGTRAARSHSAAMAGTDDVLDAAFRQCGVIRATELHELVDVAVALLGQPLPRGRNVGVLTMGGGMAVITADALRRNGLELPALSSTTMARLDALLSRRWSGGNPVDPAGDFASYEALWPLIEDEALDAIVVVGAVGAPASYTNWAPPLMKRDTKQIVKGLVDGELKSVETTIDLMAKHRKPVMFAAGAALAETKGKIARRLQRAHLNVHSSPERSATVLAHLVRYSEYLGLA